MYSHVLLDADNTLLDFNKAQLLSFKTMLLYFGIVFTNDLYKKYELINHELWHQFEQEKIGKELVQSKRFFEFFKLLGVSVNGDYVNSVYQQELCKQSWLMPHAEEVCKELSLYTTLSIVTNGVRDTQAKRIDNSKIRKYITNLVVSETIGYAKPNINFFNEVFRVIGCTRKDEILIVGDSIESDMQGGKNAGIDTCWYNPYRIKSLHRFMPNYIINDLRELKSIITSYHAK